MTKMTYNQVHEFVEKTPNASWNGWCVELFKVNPSAQYRKNGAYRDGEWGFLVRIDPDDEGLWKIRTA